LDDAANGKIVDASVPHDAIVSAAVVANVVVPSEELLSGETPSPVEDMVLDSDSDDEVIVPSIETPVIISSTPLETVHEMDIDEDAVSEIVLDEEKASPTVIVTVDSNKENEMVDDIPPISAGVFGSENGVLQKDVIVDSAMEASRSVEKEDDAQIIKIEEIEITEYVLEEGTSKDVISADNISVILPLGTIMEEDEEAMSPPPPVERNMSITEMVLPGPDLYAEIMDQVNSENEKEASLENAAVAEKKAAVPAVNRILDDGPGRHSMSVERPVASALEDPKYRKRCVSS
jgi:hypothetical protein